MATPESGAAGAPPAPPVVPSPKKSRAGLGAVIAVVVVVIILLALLFSGAIPGFKLGSSGGGGEGGGGGGGTAPSYNVTFTESGLPSSTSWSVTFNGSTTTSHTASIVFQAKNGTYAWTVSPVSGYAPSTASGSLAVAGADVSQAITFTAAATYSITFSESGLTSGATWTVTLGGSPLSSHTSTIVFTEVNGSYSWSASASGYSASPSSGSVTVAGANVTQSVNFTAVAATLYAVTFTESGLPSGTAWSVTFNGSTNSSSTSSIAFTIANGSWPFTVGTVTGYTASPSSGSVAVSGAATSQAIAFTASGGGGGGGQTKFSQAYPVAAGVVGSGWVGVYGAGISVTSTWSNSSQPTWNNTCPLTGGPSSWPTLSPWTGAYANGYTTYWVFAFYQNVSGVPTLQLVWVTGSSGTSLGSISGSSCVDPFFDYTSGLASVAIDSDAAANAVAANDSAYVSAHPSATAIYSLSAGFSYGFGGYSFTFSPEWFVSFTTCTASGGGTGYNFTATVNATSGQVTSSNTSTGTCAPAQYAPHASGPLGHADFAGLLALLQARRA